MEPFVPNQGITYLWPRVAVHRGAGDGVTGMVLRWRAYGMMRRVGPRSRKRHGYGI